MGLRAARFICGLALVAGLCSGQTAQLPSDYIEIKLPTGIISEGVFIRYVLAGEEFGGWVRPQPGVSSYLISTTREGRRTTRIKALLYAPGCAIQTLDLPLLGSNNQQYPFICYPLSNVRVSGALTRTQWPYARKVKLQTKYVARWAQSFLGVHDIVTTIPVGDVVDLSADGRFGLSVPEFSRDPLAGAPDHLGEFQIWARDKISGDILAQLVPEEPQIRKGRMGGLKIQSEYPSEMVFAPCAAVLHDAEGFALRTAFKACNH